MHGGGVLFLLTTSGGLCADTYEWTETIGGRVSVALVNARGQLTSLFRVFTISLILGCHENTSFFHQSNLLFIVIIQIHSGSGNG
jgi:hypothetical protein